MAEKIQAMQALGLELNVTGLKLAELSFSRGLPQIDQLTTFLFDTGRREVNPAYLTEEETSQIDLSGKTLIASAIDANETLVRPLDIKLKKEKDIDAVLLFQAEPLLPYPSTEALVEKIVIDSSSEGTHLTLLAIKKEHLRRHLEHWKSLEIEPEVVTSTPAALSTFSQFILKDTAPTAYYLLHIGIDQTCCLFIKHQRLIASKTSPMNLNTLRQAFGKDKQIEQDELLDKAFRGIQWADIDAIPASQLGQAIKNFNAELNKVIFSLMKQVKELDAPKIFVTGDIVEFPELIQRLLNSFTGNFLHAEDTISPAFSNIELQKYALPIGAALSGLPSSGDQVNYLKGEFSYSHPWRRLLKPIAIYFGLSCLLTLAFFAFGNAYIAKKENALQHQYAALLQTMHEPYQEFEAEVAAKIPSQLVPGSIPPIESLSQEDIRTRLGILERKLQSVPDLFQLTPNVPKVSDLLAWLSTHPNIIGQDPSNPLIQIDGISYTMLKRPELNKKQEKYQIKAEIDFTSANATAAREFHDALLAPNDFIDPKAEVKWTNNKGHYKAVLMLRDKTIYP